MAQLINLKQEELTEGVLLNRFFENRMVRRNQNIIGGVTGTTGSGKSYACLRIAELWYRHRFNQEFPMENVCFCVEEVMRLLSSGKLRKGELIILEEAGVNLGSLDFNNKVSKLFGYVLQSFRSMNVGLIMNLPVLSMLNKSARLLMHFHMITSGIDYDNKTCKLKPFFHQLNQQSGKVYPKYMRVRIGKRTRKIQRFNYSLPSEEMIRKYELKKLKFVTEFNEGFLNTLEEQRRKEAIKMARDDLTDKQREVFELISQGKSEREVAEMKGISISAISQTVQAIKNKGFKIELTYGGRRIKNIEP